jgi:hypothetical protein
MHREWSDFESLLVEINEDEDGFQCMLIVGSNHHVSWDDLRC